MANRRARLRAFAKYDWLKWTDIERGPFAPFTLESGNWLRDDDRRLFLIALDRYADWLTSPMIDSTADDTSAEAMARPEGGHQARTLPDLPQAERQQGHESALRNLREDTQSLPATPISHRLPSEG